MVALVEILTRSLTASITERIERQKINSDAPCCAFHQKLSISTRRSMTENEDAAANVCCWLFTSIVGFDGAIFCPIFLFIFLCFTFDLSSFAPFLFLFSSPFLSLFFRLYSFRLLSSPFSSCSLLPLLRLLVPTVSLVLQLVVCNNSKKKKEKDKKQMK